MGVFFTNYQVRTEDAAACAKAVAKVIQARALITSSKAGWVSIYDESSESQELTELERVARELSVRLATEVFALLVHDSDLFVYLLYRKGKPVDRFNSRPDYFGSVTAAESRKWSGQFQKLLPFAPSGSSLKKFQLVMRKKHVFQEKLAREFAGLMRIDPGRATAGFRYLENGEHDFQLIHAHGHSEGDAALAAWVEKGDVEQVRSLLAKGVSPNGKSRLGESLLVNALRYGRTEIATLLIAAGADPCANPQADGLWAAAVHGNREILRILLQKPSAKLQARLSPTLAEAAMSGHVGVVEDLLTAGANPNIANEAGTTPLMSACFRGREMIWEILAGQRFPTPHDGKPSDWAAMAAALLKAGAEPNARDKNGMTALMFARGGGQQKIVEMLLEAGADPNVKPGKQIVKIAEKLRRAGPAPSEEARNEKSTEPPLATTHIDPRVRDLLLQQVAKHRETKSKTKK